MITGTHLFQLLLYSLSTYCIFTTLAQTSLKPYSTQNAFRIMALEMYQFWMRCNKYICQIDKFSMLQPLLDKYFMTIPKKIR